MAEVSHGVTILIEIEPAESCHQTMAQLATAANATTPVPMQMRRGHCDRAVSRYGRSY